MNCPFAEQCSTAILALVPRFLILFMLIFNFPHTADPPPPSNLLSYKTLRYPRRNASRSLPSPREQDEYKPTHYFSRVSLAIERLNKKRRRRRGKKRGKMYVAIQKLYCNRRVQLKRGDGWIRNQNLGKKGQINFTRFRIENLKCSASFCCLFVAGGWVEFLPTRAIPLDSQILSRTNSKEIFPFPIPPITQTAGDSKPRSSFRDGNFGMANSEEEEKRKDRSWGGREYAF